MVAHLDLVLAGCIGGERQFLQMLIEDLLMGNF